MMDRIHFQEAQKFNNPWLWAILLASMGLCLFLAASAFLSDSPDVVALTVAAIAVIGIAIMMASLTLKTTITENEIVASFGFLFRKRLKREDVEQARVRKYSPLGEYGGWGIKMGPSGTSYTTMGDHGLQLKLSNGKKLLIGTQRPEELQEIINTWLSEYDDGEPLKLADLQRNPLKSDLS